MREDIGVWILLAPTGFFIQGHQALDLGPEVVARVDCGRHDWARIIEHNEWWIHRGPWYPLPIPSKQSAQIDLCGQTDRDPPLGAGSRLSVERLAVLHRGASGFYDHDFGVSSAEIDVLATLRLAGFPYQQTPTAIPANVVITSGGVTKRLDRLEANGLIERRSDPSDRRGWLISLTDRGSRAHRPDPPPQPCHWGAVPGRRRHL